MTIWEEEYREEEKKEREKETMDSMPVLNYEWLYGVYIYTYLRDTTEQGNNLRLILHTTHLLSFHIAHISLGASEPDSVAHH